VATDSNNLKRISHQLLENRSNQMLDEALAPDLKTSYHRFPNGSDCSPEQIRKRWAYLETHQGACSINDNSLFDHESLMAYQGNIENCIGTIKMPLGIAGPVRVNGAHAQGDFLLPMATTEAALIASYHRGAVLISKAGGCSSVVLSEGVTRSPCFSFNTISDALNFSHWILAQQEKITEVAQSTTNHGKLVALRIAVEGNHMYLLCDFTTGDAAGQNMVTIATQAICEYIIAHTPIQPVQWFVEANASGDKKACAQSFTTVRGKKVTVEVLIPERLIKRLLHTSVDKMIDYWQMSAIGGVMTGTMGIQGHYANGLAAMFIATGQDAACVAEAAVGITRLEKRANGALYASVTLPNLIVGTVGGGTKLPSQKDCLSLMGLPDNNQAKAYAEVCAAAILAGELSIIGSLSAGDFTHAHHSLARQR